MIKMMMYSLKFFVRMVAQDEESFIMKFYRNKGSQDVGTGKVVIVDATKRFKYLFKREL